MLELKKIITGVLKENCYILSDGKSKDAVIIDPGDDADYIQQMVSDMAVIPVSIFLTHGHFDHVMATTELKLNYKIPICMNKKDLIIYRRAKKTAEHFTQGKYLPVLNPDIFVKNNENVQIGKSSFEILETPGHTPGSISCILRAEKIVIVGDLFFADGIGRHDFSYSDKANIYASIGKILALPDDFTIMAGHGEDFSVSDAKNRFSNL